MHTHHPKNAVVFGGTGFVGRNLIKALANQDWNLSIVCRRPHRHRDLLVMPNVQFVETEKLELDTIRTLLTKGDTVVNLIGILNESKGRTFEAVHCELPRIIAQICLENHARRLIHISSLGADVNAPSQYLKSKGRGEQAIFNAVEQGLQSEIIRPSVIFGSDDSFTRQFAKLLKLAKGFFVVVSPDSQMQPVYIGDVVSCIVHAMNQHHCSCESFDVAGPQVFTLYELVSLIDKMSGGRHKILRLNSSLSKLLANFMQFLPGKPLTLDNLLSLQVPNIIREDFPKPYGVQPRSFEDTANSWLRPQFNRLDDYRSQAGR